MIRWIVLLACVGYAVENLIEKVGPGVFTTKNIIKLSAGFTGPSIKDNPRAISSSFKTQVQGKMIKITPVAKVKFSGISMIIKGSKNNVGPYSIVAGWGNLPANSSNRTQKIINDQIISKKNYINLHLYSDDKIIQKGLISLTNNRAIQIKGYRTVLEYRGNKIGSYIQKHNNIPLEVIWVKHLQIGKTEYR